MKRFASVIVVFILLIAKAGYSQQPLPKGLTDEEKKVYDEFIHNPNSMNLTSPPAAPPRTPAEWEEAQGVLITWAGYSSELREIVKKAVEAVTVYIICSDPSDVQSYLSNGGVDLDNVVMVQAPFNSVWVRDYGPQSVYLENGDLAFIDWLYNRPYRPDDNNIPSFMAGYMDVPYYEIGGEDGQLIATGGNFMSDGHGTGFSSKLILSENPSYSEAEIDQIKYDYMGIYRYVKMEELPYDNISHIDMHMKLLDEETLLVGEFPQGVSDGPYIENNLQYVLDNFKTAFDNDYEVVRIPMVPSSGGAYPPNTYYRTFTNAIILNNIVLVPQYGHALDATGIQVYEDAMPGYEVYGIYMENVIPASGAIHCITREIAADDPVLISHAKKRFTLVEDSQIDFDARITSPSGISEAYLYWTADTDNGFNAIEMEPDDSENYYAEITAEFEEGTIINYYISATNNNNKTITKPLVAPEGYYSFEVELVDDTNIESSVIPTFNVFPNPAIDYVNVSVSPEMTGGEITISNINGKIMYKENIIPANDFVSKRIPLNNYPQGVYFIIIKNNELLEVKKIIKQ